MLHFFHREQSEELGINLVAYVLQVGCAFAKLARVAVDDYQLSAIAGNPFLVAAVEPFEIIQTDSLLVLLRM